MPSSRPNVVTRGTRVRARRARLCERRERMTRVPSTEPVEMGATRADFSLGVGAEIALPALRPRLVGEARHLHKTQVPHARGPQASGWLPRQSTHSDLNFSSSKLFPPAFMLSIIVDLLSLLRVGSPQTRPKSFGCFTRPASFNLCRNPLLIGRPVLQQFMQDSLKSDSSLKAAQKD
jgi:hypothetical protein